MGSRKKAGVEDVKPKARAKAKAKVKKQQAADLRTSFQSAASNQKQHPQDAEDVQRSHQSLFVTYCKNTTMAKDQIAASQAQRILNDYKQMTPEQKKLVVVNFFKGGGRKSGLSSVFRQVAKTESDANEKMWQGYCTPDMVLDFFKVHDPKT